LNAHLSVQVVDLSIIKAPELDELWRHEMRVWRDRLLWDVSHGVAALRRIIERGGLPGKAVQVGSRTVGYAYYGIAGRLGVIGGVVVAPAWNNPDVGERLLQRTIDEIRAKGVSRIESQFLAIDCPWLSPAFERQGFRTYWREFLRLDIRRPQRAVSPLAMVSLEPWREADLPDAASMLEAAYHDGVEAEIHQRYRSADGCRAVLENIVSQGSCGPLVAEASAIARHRGRSIGCSVITEVAPRQGHLAQVVVLPEYQRRGIGRLLLDYSVSQLAARQFDTLCLLVSRANQSALRLYRAMGFQAVLAFPAFTWERECLSRHAAARTLQPNP
jgi:ribosomal protein S18 acetylase RimI-like enzyme